MVYMIRADVDRWRELEVIVDLPSAEVVQIELESLEVEDHVVGNFLEACSGSN